MSSRKSSKHKTLKSKTRRSIKLPLAIGLLAIITVAVVVFYVYGLNGSSSGNKILLHTSMGDITFQLRDDKPITTSNFKNLVQQGVYGGTIFHRVIADFMIQDGLNTSASVATIPDEIGSCMFRKL